MSVISIIRNSLIWITLLILLIITLFIIFSALYKPTFQQTFITPNQTDTKVICTSEKVICDPSTENPCSQCVDNIEISCQLLERTQEQQKNFGEQNYYCLPQKPEQPCDKTKGGIWTWTGWASTERMEWDCLCAYAGYAGNNGCTEWNPGICQGGTFDYDATKSTYENSAPSPENCTCPTNTTKMITDSGNGIPICVSNNTCTSAEECCAMYSDSVMGSGECTGKCINIGESC